jgi:hypothetical protein
LHPHFSPRASARAHPYITAAMQIYLIDEPSPFATLVTWEQHLRKVESLPPDTLLAAELVEAAEAAVTRLREG